MLIRLAVIVLILFYPVSVAGAAPPQPCDGPMAHTATMCCCCCEVMPTVPEEAVCTCNPAPAVPAPDPFLPQTTVKTPTPAVTLVATMTVGAQIHLPSAARRLTNALISAPPNERRSLLCVWRT